MKKIKRDYYPPVKKSPLFIVGEKLKHWKHRTWTIEIGERQWCDDLGIYKYVVLVDTCTNKVSTVLTENALMRMVEKGKPVS